MIVLGISNNDYAGACLIIDGKIIAAASEERFTRVKAHKTFPFSAIEFVLSEANLKLTDIDKFAYGWSAGFSKDKHLELYFDRIVEGCLEDPTSITALRKRVIDEINNDIEKRNEFDSYLASNNVLHKAHYVDHHEAHAHAAMLSSPFDNGIAVSCDGRGDFQSLTISRFENGQFTTLQRETTFDSLGYFYGRITALLGFKPNRHEGKITGLAAHGDPYKLLNKMKQLIDVNESGRIRAKFHSGYLPSYNDNYDLLQTLFDGDSKEDIAAAAQQHLEDILTRVVGQHIDVNTPVNLCLAGGVFGNVKLNQHLRQMQGVNNLFVLPSMGDDGLPLGAAVVASFELTGKRANTETMKLGPDITVDDTLIQSLKDSGYQTFEGGQTEIVNAVLSSLENKKILGLVRGRMEFGPRALCSRSIVCSAKDKSINQWLNHRMNRTEFMPFAPIIADIFAPDSFIGWNSTDIASEFMTVTYDCTDYFAQACPAVTHIDKTARPQVITQQSDPFMHRVLVGWESISGEPALINTSFNMHEEPIILNIDNALKNLERGVVDVLVINEQLLVWKSDSSKN